MVCLITAGIALPPPPEQNPEVNDNYTFDDLSFTDDEFKRFPSIT